MLEAIGIILGYLAGIFVISYVHGRLKPDQYKMGEPEMFFTGIWPAALVLVIPVGLIIGLIVGIGKAAEWLRDKGVDHADARRAATERQTELTQTVESIEYFEDSNDVGV